MRSFLVATLIAAWAVPALSDEPDVAVIVEQHILPRYELLSMEASELSATAATDCAPDNANLITAYHEAFDAWVGVSHLRFGPSEQEDRAFALAFWPDPRGSTPKALNALIRAEDPVVLNEEDFRAISIAARGFYALEFLLFDPQFTKAEIADYHCQLVRAVATDIAHNASAILVGWKGGYGDLMVNTGNNTYRTSKEAAQQIFTALMTGLEFTSQTRLGRPLGTFDRPRPNRAEARRSERSLRHVLLSLAATRELADFISPGNEDLARAFGIALQRAESLDDPVFANVIDPRERFNIEVLQQNIDAIRAILAEDVGPLIGITAGFNSLDGD